MPCFNEAKTIRTIVARVLAQPLDLELVIVDDGSTDGTIEIIGDLAKADKRIRLFFQPKNMGKGAALRRGFEESTGEIVVVQDADLEYDPDEFKTLIEPIVSGRADVVFGS
ncbi:MAG: glycosyltransferase family 2 protein, partial [Polyangiaceae bacterium]